MSKRRLDKLEGSLFAKEAVLHWLGEAHAFGSLPTYTESLIEQPETEQPFVALPSQVSGASWESMRRQRPGFIKKVTREGRRRHGLPAPARHRPQRPRRGNPSHRGAAACRVGVVVAGTRL